MFGSMSVFIHSIYLEILMKVERTGQITWSYNPSEFKVLVLMIIDDEKFSCINSTVKSVKM
jgi:hypothetical protein